MMEWGEQDLQREEYYSVEKILDMKEQGGKRYYLVKWLNWDVKTCTWEEQSNVQHLKSLIKDYQQSKKFDRQQNLGIKKLDVIYQGTSPYEATKYYGHVLYGDQPERVVSVQMIEKGATREMHLEVEWATRDNGFKPTNSVIESTTLLEHCPSFTVDFLEKRVQLMAPAEVMSKKQ